jgi:CubicO group peptidase (beta-lactamase class C family)
LQWGPGVRAGTKFAYSNSGYVILGAVIEQVTGKSYEQVSGGIRRHRHEGLGVRACRVADPAGSGYENRAEGICNADFVDMSQPHAAGAIYSTVQDLYLWDQALYGTNLLSDTTKKKMFTAGLGDYGYGWRVRRAPAGPQKAERIVLMHTGVINGFSSLILRIPDERVLIVLLNNTGRVNLVAIAQGIGDILYGREPPLPK